MDLAAGVDEVGRGALFGPVVAAAVILSQESVGQLAASGVKDSKQLSAKRRLVLASQIRKMAMSWSIGMASVHEIDRLNILQATLLAMKRAVVKLSLVPSYCLIDGNQTIPGLMIPQQAVIKGDQLDTSIAAASILAKVWRDSLMIRLDKRYSGYHLAKNKGYGSAQHRAAIAQQGLSPQHRRSFKITQVSQPPDAREGDQLTFQAMLSEDLIS